MKAESQLKEDFKRLDDDLRLNKHSTPWARHFVEDLELLRHIEDGQAFWKMFEAQPHCQAWR